MTAFTRGLPHVLLLTGILLLEFACARTDSLLPPRVKAVMGLGNLVCTDSA